MIVKITERRVRADPQELIGVIDSHGLRCSQRRTVAMRVRGFVVMEWIEGEDGTHTIGAYGHTPVTILSPASKLPPPPPCSPSATSLLFHLRPLLVSSPRRLTSVLAFCNARPPAKVETRACSFARSARAAKGPFQCW